MKVFATRVWDFDPYRWPVITFSLRGNRDKLLNESAPGDRIVFVGTQEEPTAKHHRGRMLGMAEIGREPVDPLKVIRPEGIGVEDYDSKDNFRFSHAVLMIHAWKFEPQPLLHEVLSKQLPYSATSQAVELAEADKDAVLSLRVAVVDLPDSSTIQNARHRNRALSKGGPTTGPKPTSWSGEISRDTARPAWTYALRFGITDLWKIGHTVDLKERVRQISLHIPTEVIKDQWKLVYTHEWPDETDAHSMEQRVLADLAGKRTVAERLRCSEHELFDVWVKAIVGAN